MVFVPFHRIYVEQYAVYFPLLTRAEWAQREKELRADREKRVRTDAAPAPGFDLPNFVFKDY